MNSPICPVAPETTSSWFSNAAIVATFLGALTFVCGYAWTTRGHWRTTMMGKHIMTFMVVILIVTSLAVISIFYGRNWPHRELIRGAAWSAVAAVTWWRVALLRRLQLVPLNPGQRHRTPER